MAPPMCVFGPMIAAILFAVPTVLSAREPEPGADQWLTNAPPYPERFRASVITTNPFANLRAEVVAGRFRVSCSATGFAEVRLTASAEAPGHWLARDWESHVMLSNAATWFLELPIENLRVPVVYFVAATLGDSSVASPPRLALPAALGMEEQTRFFWPFVEGFEQGAERWAGDTARIQTDSLGRHGRAALLVRVPPRGRSVTVTTTRLRGWHLEEHGARGVALWVRTRAGTGSVSFSLLANAYTTNQVVARRPEAISVSPRWTNVQLPFETFPKISLGEIDLFSIELTAPPATEFLIDDVYLLGRWPNDF